MIKLLYLSTECKNQNSAEKNLREILETSKRNNVALGITGILVHGGGMFLQVIEGPQEQVMRQYVKILDDKRHTDCEIVLITICDRRSFPQWSMASLELPAHDFQAIESMIHHRPQALDAKWFNEVISLFMKKAIKNS